MIRASTPSMPPFGTALRTALRTARSAAVPSVFCGVLSVLLLSACFVPEEVVVPVDSVEEQTDALPFRGVVQVSASRNFGGDVEPQRFTGWWLTEEIVVTSLRVVTTCDECPLFVETIDGEELEAAVVAFSLAHDMVALAVSPPVEAPAPLTLATPTADEGDLLAALGHPRDAVEAGRWWALEAEAGAECDELGAREVLVAADEGIAGGPVVDACGRVVGHIASNVSWPEILCAEFLDEGDVVGAGERSAPGTRHYVATPEALSWLLSVAPGAAVEADRCDDEFPEPEPEGEPDVPAPADDETIDLAADVVWWNQSGMVISTPLDLFVTSSDVGYEFAEIGLMAGLLTGEIDVMIDEFDVQTFIVETPIPFTSFFEEEIVTSWAALDEPNRLAWFTGESESPGVSGRSGEALLNGDALFGLGASPSSGDDLITWSAEAEVVDGRVFAELPTSRGGHIVFAQDAEWIGVSLGCVATEQLGDAREEFVFSVPIAPGCAQEIVRVADALEALLAAE